MDTVSAMNQVMTLLRQELLQRDRNARKADARTVGSAEVAVNKSHSESNHSNLGLLAQVDELKSHGVSDTDSLIRYVVESLLSREFGHTMRNDPEFQLMVDEVHHALVDSPYIRSLFQQSEAGDSLAAGKNAVE
jgi:hypothetical protein